MRAALLPIFAAVFVSTLAADPHVGYVYPAGARQGTTIEVRLGGQQLFGISKAYISGKGVEIVSVEPVKMPNGKETQFMREEMQKLNEKRAAATRFYMPAGQTKSVFTEDERKRLEELREKLEDWQRRQFIPSIAEVVAVKLNIAPDAPLGPRQLRLEGGGGLTNPIMFCVGDLPEYAHKPGHVGQLYNVVNGGVAQIRPNAKEPDPPTEVQIPVVVNGQMLPGATDQYKFHAKKGQHIVVAADARELIPYVSDAVPGWFQAAISLRDASGKQLASADHFLFHPDPLLEYEIPADGDYIAAIHDSIFRGREDFVYRMTIGELPVITSIFPLGGKAGSRTTIQTTGWNLLSPKLVENFQGKSEAVHPITVAKDGMTSNSVSLAVDTLPEAAVKSGNDIRKKAQKVKLPIILNGRIAKPGETANFRFDGQAGQEIVAEVMARRLGSPLDSVIRLTDASGRQLAFNDDFEDKGAGDGLITHQADSFFRFKLPAKGTYYLQIADTQHKGGPEYGYRLRISQPRPDFELRVVPSSFNVRAGATVPFTVYALRRDEFSGEIALTLKDAPSNFVLSGATIPSGQDHVRVTVTVLRTPGQQPLSLQLTGQAKVEGRDVSRTAVPAEDMEQAFAYHHIVTEDAWLVRVLGGGSTQPWKTVAKPVTLQAGVAAPFTVTAPYRIPGGLELALNDPPEGISIQKVTPEGNGYSIVLAVQPDKVKPGLKGNLILDAFRPQQATPAVGVRQNRRQSMGTLPAVPFEVVGTQSK